MANTGGTGYLELAKRQNQKDQLTKRYHPADFLVHNLICINNWSVERATVVFDHWHNFVFWKSLLRVDLSSWILYGRADACA